MLQMNATPERPMSSTATSPLHELWSIVLSKAAAKGDAKGDAKGELNDVRGVGGAVKVDSKLGRRAHEHRESAVELFTIPEHLSAKQAYVIVKLGIPSRSLAPLSDHLGIGKGAAAGFLGMDRATANRKVAKDDVLPTYAAESMLRLLELDAMARDTFETDEEAAAWLRQPHPMLDGETPLDCAKSGFGAERVKDILNAVKYGGVV
jgi:putative toxin-antitoxin system antitoxin component (TIGR02293 family)